MNNHDSLLHREFNHNTHYFKSTCQKITTLKESCFKCKEVFEFTTDPTKANPLYTDPDPSLIMLVRDHNSDWLCVLTREMDLYLDRMSRKHLCFCHTYLYDLEFECKTSSSEYCIPIRIPGCTIGGLYYNEEGFISEIQLDKKSMERRGYDPEVHHMVQKYIGRQIMVTNPDSHAIQTILEYRKEVRGELL